MQDDATTVLGRLHAAFGCETDSELAQRIEVPAGTISSWRARGAVPIRELFAAADKGNLSIEWVAHGIGPKSRSDLPALMNIARQFIPILSHNIYFDADKKEARPSELRPADIAFGRRLYEDVAPATHIPLYAFSVTDDWMSPTLPVTATVAVDVSTDHGASMHRPARQTGIYCLYFNRLKRFSFRRLRSEGSRIKLSWDNRKYLDSDGELADHTTDFDVVGRAVWCGTKLD